MILLLIGNKHCFIKNSLFIAGVLKIFFNILKMIFDMDNFSPKLLSYLCNVIVSFKCIVSSYLCNVVSSRDATNMTSHDVVFRANINWKRHVTPECVVL